MNCVEIFNICDEYFVEMLISIIDDITYRYKIDLFLNHFHAETILFHAN